MTSWRFSFQKFRSEYPPQQEPAWAVGRVERWYQLDVAAYSLCEAYARLDLERASKPQILFLASPSGCNATDAQFARGGASSPAKFVHTLPNIRGSVLLQVMQWHGPVLCFQQDPVTMVSALKQASSFADQALWIAGVDGQGEAYFMRSDANGEFALDALPESTGVAVEDAALKSWLSQPSAEFALGEGFVLRRLERP